MKDSPSNSLFAPWGVLTLVSLFILALSIRLYDVSDPPLDFHPTRQVLSALKARGMYVQDRGGLPEWQRQFAVQQWKSKAEIEPEIVERLAALTYRVTGEQLWVGRVYSSIFWLAGGLFLFLLLRERVSWDGALLGTAFHLFLPYGIVASRSFQPDPLMVMLVIAYWWAVNHWARSAVYSPLPPGDREASRSEAEGGLGVRAWSWAIAAGLIGGLAILVKFSAAFFVIGGGLGVLLGRGSLRQDLRRPQLWTMAALGVLPGAVYLTYGIFVAGFLGRQFSGRFIPALLVSPDFYLNWLSTLNHVLGGPVLALALLGIFFTRERAARLFLISLWAAYAVYGFFFNYHIWSHDYYNLPLIPIAALSLAAPGERFMARLMEAVAGSRAQRLMAAAVLTAGLFAVLWEARAVLKSVDSRPAAAMWTEIGARLGPQARLVSLTEDYGSSLAYWGWLDSAVWPQAGDIAYHSDLRGARGEFEKRFQNLALKREFFLVTLPDELDLQPLLKERLDEYPLLFEGDGYVIYDLR